MSKLKFSEPSPSDTELRAKMFVRLETLNSGIQAYADSLARDPFSAIIHPSFVATLIDYTGEQYVLNVLTRRVTDFTAQTVADYCDRLLQVQDNIQPNKENPDQIRLDKAIRTWIGVWKQRALKTAEPTSR